MPTTLDFIETPLQDVVDYLKDLHHIEIQLDDTAMDAAKVSADAPVTVNFKRVTLKKALHGILDKHGLSCVVADQVLLITTAKEAQQRWLVKAYRLKPDDALRIAPGAQPGGKAVAEKITATIAPKTWRPVGGGAIAPVSLGKYDVLVVRQTFDVHWQIAGLLNPVLADRPERTGK